MQQLYDYKYKLIISIICFIITLLLLISACTIHKNISIPEQVTLSNDKLVKHWLLVDTKKDALMVMYGNKIVKYFNNIALGSSGAGFKEKSGDNKTPIGLFNVSWINDHSRFKIFIGINYPNSQYAERALRKHKIDRLTYERICTAITGGQIPPQDTVIGGQIGIHGVGYGNIAIHHAGINWTSGCIALDNQQIIDLRTWIYLGMPVEIR